MDSKKYIGMDVHKESISIAVMNGAGKIVMECVIETNLTGRFHKVWDDPPIRSRPDFPVLLGLSLGLLRHCGLQGKKRHSLYIWTCDTLPGL